MTTSGLEKARAESRRCAWRGEIERLRTELAEMAFALDRRGRPEAADVAMTISARLEEICEAARAAKPPVEGRSLS